MAKKSKVKSETSSARPVLQTAKPNSEWFVDRLDSVGLNQLSISRKFGPSPNWFRKTFITNERAKLSVLGEIAWVAEQLKASGAEVIRNLGFRLPGAFVPVVGFVNGESHLIVQRGELKEAAPPNSVPETAAAHYKDGPNAFGLNDRSVLYFSLIENKARLIEGRLTVFKLVTGAIVVALAEHTMAEGTRITLLDGKTQITLNVRDIEAAAPVEWLRML